MEDDFRVIVIKRVEIERMFREHKTLQSVFRELRKISEERGLSYSKRLWLQSWWDSAGNLRQKNYIQSLPQEEQA
jgi:hypothetical protein